MYIGKSMGLGCMGDKTEGKMTEAEKKQKIVDHLESFERLAGRVDKCKVIPKDSKIILTKHIASMRSELAKVYGS